jgi:hypothetical protein
MENVQEYKRIVLLIILFPSFPRDPEMSKLLGLDLGSLPIPASAIQRSLLQADPSISDPVAFLQPNALGVFLFLPSSIEKSIFPNWMLGLHVALDTVVAAAFKNPNSPSPAIFVSDKSGLIYSSGNEGQLLKELSTITVPIIDTTWQVQFQGSTTFCDPFLSAWPTVVLVMIILMFIPFAEAVRRGGLRFLSLQTFAKHVAHRDHMVLTLQNSSETILQAVPDPIVVLDGMGYIIGLNLSALKRLGLPENSIACVHVSDILKSIKSMEPATPGTYEVGLLGLPGCEFEAEVTASQVMNRNRGELAQVLIFHDVSDRVAAVNKVKEAEIEARSALKTKSRILLFISHELRNPIYVIESVADSILALNDPNLAVALEIKESTFLLSEILENLEDLMQPISQNCKKAHLSSVALPSLVAAASEDIRYIIQQKSLQVEEWVDPHPLHGCTCSLVHLLSKFYYFTLRAAHSGTRCCIEISIDRDQNLHAVHRIHSLNYYANLLSAPGQRSINCEPDSREGLTHHHKQGLLELVFTVLNQQVRECHGNVYIFNVAHRSGLDLILPLEPLRLQVTSPFSCCECECERVTNSRKHLSLDKRFSFLNSSTVESEQASLKNQGQVVKFPFKTDGANIIRSHPKNVVVSENENCSNEYLSPQESPVSTSANQSPVPEKDAISCPPHEPQQSNPNRQGTVATFTGDAKYIYPLPLAGKVGSKSNYNCDQAAESPNGGSVSSPCADAKEAEGGWDPTQPAQKIPSKKRVLLVEDNSLVRKMTRKMVESLDFIVDTAIDGNEAVQIVLATPHAYGIVLMDLVMPNKEYAFILVTV